jgi:predicted nuclease with TOPRIM domain
MESGNRTAAIIKKIEDSVLSHQTKYGFHSFFDFLLEDTDELSQQCEALQSENERLKSAMVIEMQANETIKKDHARLLERVKELTEALMSIEPFALSSLKKIIAALNPKE